MTCAPCMDTLAVGYVLWVPAGKPIKNFGVSIYASGSDHPGPLPYETQNL